MKKREAKSALTLRQQEEDIRNIFVTGSALAAATLQEAGDGQPNSYEDDLEAEEEEFDLKAYEVRAREMRTAALANIKDNPVAYLARLSDRSDNPVALSLRGKSLALEVVLEAIDDDDESRAQLNAKWSKPEQLEVAAQGGDVPRMINFLLLPEEIVEALLDHVASMNGNPYMRALVVKSWAHTISSRGDYEDVLKVVVDCEGHDWDEMLMVAVLTDCVWETCTDPHDPDELEGALADVGLPPIGTLVNNYDGIQDYLDSLWQRGPRDPVERERQIAEAVAVKKAARQTAEEEKETLAQQAIDAMDELENV